MPEGVVGCDGTPLEHVRITLRQRPTLRAEQRVRVGIETEHVTIERFVRDRHPGRAADVQQLQFLHQPAIGDSHGGGATAGQELDARPGEFAGDGRACRRLRAVVSHHQFHLPAEHTAGAVVGRHHQPLPDDVGLAEDGIRAGQGIGDADANRPGLGKGQ